MDRGINPILVVDNVDRGPSEVLGPNSVDDVRLLELETGPDEAIG